MNVERIDADMLGKPMVELKFVDVGPGDWNQIVDVLSDPKLPEYVVFTLFTHVYLMHTLAERTSFVMGVQAVRTQLENYEIDVKDHIRKKWRPGLRIRKRTRGPSKLQQLRDLGFDESTVVPFEGRWRVKCSQCEALSINGMPTHETGCPNARKAKHREEEEDEG